MAAVSAGIYTRFRFTLTFLGSFRMNSHEKEFVFTGGLYGPFRYGRRICARRKGRLSAGETALGGLRWELAKNFSYHLTNGNGSAILVANQIQQTVEAEITVVMLVQRAREAESRAKHRPSNGPRRVQSKAQALR